MAKDRAVISKIRGGLQAKVAKEGEEDERTQLMLDATPLCIFIVDRNYQNIDCNQEAVKMFELRDKQEFINRFWELHPEYQPDGRNSLERAKEILNKAYEEGYSRFEWMCQKLNGEPVPCGVTLVRVKYKDGYIVLGYIRDLREHKKMMGEIKRRDDLLRSVNHAATTMLAVDNDEKFEGSLLSGMELIGLRMDVDRVQIWQNEMIGGKLHAVCKYGWLSDIGRQKASAPIGMKILYSDKVKWKDMFFRGEYINTPVCKMEKNDQKFLSAYAVKSIVLIPLFSHDQFWGVFVLDDCRRERTFSEEEIDILRSVSLMMTNAVNRHLQVGEMNKTTKELRLARDAAEAATKTKSTFIANMSHEIRTPMNSIIGFSELALDDDIPAKTREYLNKIRENADWLLQIINDILDTAKIESGKLELENIPFDLHQIFVFCQTAILPKAIEKSVSLHFYAEPSIGKMLLGDPIRLRQVLINLLSNAVKFTNIGTVKVSSDIINSTEKNITMHFEVRDSGIGMTPEQINKIYEPFSQADVSTTRQYGGTGLGIPIAKNIVNLMGGEMVVESTPGVGSKFSFDLTFDTVDLPMELSVHETINEKEKPIFKGEVLVCEDNTMNQQVICEHLTRVGLDAVVAHNGREGVDMVKSRIDTGEKPFDLIFMDIHMPVMDGLEAASMITELQTGAPIVAMTANVMPSDKELYQLSGLPDCLGKPFTSQELWRCLMKYLIPVRRGIVNAERQAEEDTQLRRQLRINFVKDNQTKFVEIVDAIGKNDVKLAHRLAHTMKSNAGQIGETGLQNAAAVVERLLKNGDDVLEKEAMISFKDELSAVLEKLAPLLCRTELPAESFYKEKALLLLEKLKPMLQNRNPECQNLLDDIRAVPGAEMLAEQVEDFDFKAAIMTLAGLKEKWG